MTTMMTDEFDRPIPGEDYWLKSCREGDLASDGERITTAKALEIAFDVTSMYLEVDQGMSIHVAASHLKWRRRDIEIAMGVLYAIRAQRGIDGPDAQSLGIEDMHATRQIDIWVYG